MKLTLFISATIWFGSYQSLIGAEYGNTDHQERADVVFRDLNILPDIHGAIYDEYVTGELSNPMNHVVIEMSGVQTTKLCFPDILCVESVSGISKITLKQFKDAEQPYFGAFTHQNVLIREQRSAILTTAEDLRNRVEPIKYIIVENDPVSDIATNYIEWEDLNGNGILQSDEIVRMRSDAFVEYCYAFNGFPILESVLTNTTIINGTDNFEALANAGLLYPSNQRNAMISARIDTPNIMVKESDTGNVISNNGFSSKSSFQISVGDAFSGPRRIELWNGSPDFGGTLVAFHHDLAFDSFERTYTSADISQLGNLPEGRCTIRAVDQAGNLTSVAFTIDRTPPNPPIVTDSAGTTVENGEGRVMSEFNLTATDVISIDRAEVIGVTGTVVAVFRPAAPNSTSLTGHYPENFNSDIIFGNYRIIAYDCLGHQTSFDFAMLPPGSDPYHFTTPVVTSYSSPIPYSYPMVVSRFLMSVPGSSRVKVEFDGEISRLSDPTIEPFCKIKCPFGTPSGFGITINRQATPGGDFLPTGFISHETTCNFEVSYLQDPTHFPIECHEKLVKETGQAITVEVVITVTDGICIVDECPNGNPFYDTNIVDKFGEPIPGAYRGLKYYMKNVNISIESDPILIVTVSNASGTVSVTFPSASQGENSIVSFTLGQSTVNALETAFNGILQPIASNAVAIRTTSKYSIPAKVTIKYDDSLLLPEQEQGLKLIRISESGGFQNVTSSIDTSEKTISGYSYSGTGVIGIFAIVAPKESVPPTAEITSPPFPVKAGSFNVTLKASERLQSSSLSFTPAGKTAISIPLMTTDDITWTGTMNITDTTGEGEATFSWTGVDISGNVGTSITPGTFKIDTVVPTASISIIPPPPLIAGDVAITLIASEPLQSVLLSYALQGNPPIPVTLTGSGMNWSGTLTIAPKSGDGSATFSWVGTDLAGNIGSGSTLSGTTSFEIDSMPPIGNIKINDGADVTTSPVVTVTFDAGEFTGGIRIPPTSMLMSFDRGATYQAEEPFVESKVLTLPSEGGYVFPDGQRVFKEIFVKFKDAVGNLSRPASSGIILDSSAPSKGTVVIRKKN